MDDLYRTILGLSPKVQTLIAVLIGFMLIDDLNADQQLAIGNLFIIIGQVLITDGAQQRLVEVAKAEAQQQQLYGTINDLRDRIAALEDSGNK